LEASLVGLNVSAFFIIVRLAWNLLQWCGLLLRPRESLEAENLFLRRQLGDASYELLRLVKRAIDPNGLLNPGKIFPTRHVGC